MSVNEHAAHAAGTAALVVAATGKTGADVATVLKNTVDRPAELANLAVSNGRINAARAVGSAVGSNPVAVLIPCHRVIRESGIIGGYRWQRGRKMALLAKELAPAQAAE